MIQLLPLERRTNYGAILELYFYMVAMVMPFCPEDVFPSETFYQQGDLQKSAFPVTEFHNKSGKRARQRTNAYKSLLDKYRIVETAKLSPQERRENDALLAKRIIERAFTGAPVDRSLYFYLYEGLPKNNFHVHRNRLHCLLTTYMDTGSLKADNLCFECADPEDLCEVFRYAKFANMSEAIQLMGLLGVSVCPYCNRNFTTTISSTNGMRQGQFDHYRSKSDYPWFALSLRNLIPSCGYCNQIKGDEEKLVLYPYKEGMNQHYRFRTRPIHGIGYLIGSPLTLTEFEVLVEKGSVSATEDYDDRIQNSLKLFHLKELYQTHQEHIA
ncbi:MAG: HNH endonuclease [Lachnospiraceae bacterium]|nr:HNH endonuclease [Lachnospiraceae bacterium]